MTERGLVVGVGDLLRRPGTRREVERTFASPGLTVVGSTVPPGADVDVDVVVESTADPGTLTVSGRIAAPWTGECRRCLEPVGGSLDVEVHEVFSRRVEAGEEDEVWPLEGEEIDLGDVVADALLLALPLSPLCRPDCDGPAPREFPATVEEDDGGDEESAAEPPRDPRWAALDDLHFD